MGDFIRSITEMVEKLGGPLAMGVIVVLAAGYVVYWNKQLVNALLAAKTAMMETQAKCIDRNTGSMVENTQALKEMTSAQKNRDDWWSKFGSDPFMNICRAKEEREAEAIVVRAVVEKNKLEVLAEAVAERLEAKAAARAEELAASG